MCLAQGHKAVTPVRLEPVTLRSQDNATALPHIVIVVFNVGMPQDNKIFFMPTELSMKIQQLIKTKMLKNKHFLLSYSQLL